MVGTLALCPPYMIDALPRSRDANRARVVDQPCPSKLRAQGRPGVRCTRSLVCESEKHTSVVTTGSPERSGLPCAMVLTGSSALSLVTGLSCHHYLRNEFASLTSASGCQDHTTSPSARRALSSKRRFASTASRPAFRDDREPPLMMRRDSYFIKLILGRSGNEIFFESGLDTNLLICPSGSF
jgi:hypothetical protein